VSVAGNLTVTGTASYDTVNTNTQYNLAEAMMKAPEGGAVAVWASSSMTFPEGQALLNEELYRQLFRNRGVAPGDAIKSAKAAVSDSDVRRSWILLGDPTMRLK